jgi:hypothetical protein
MEQSHRFGLRWTIKNPRLSKSIELKEAKKAMAAPKENGDVSGSTPNQVNTFLIKEIKSPLNLPLIYIKNSWLQSNFKFVLIGLDGVSQRKAN